MAKKKSPPPTTLLMMVAGVAALALMLSLVFGQVGSIQTARDTAAEKWQAIALAQARLQQLKNLEQQAEEFIIQAKRFERMIPTQADEHDLIASIETSADRSGIDILQIRFEDRVPKEGYWEMPLRMTFEGRYDGMLSLLLDLQDNSRLIRIDDFRLGRGSRDLPWIRADITGSTFFRASGVVPGTENTVPETPFNQLVTHVMESMEGKEG